MVYFDFEDLAYFTASDWCLNCVIECFNPLKDYEIEYWSNKFNKNIFHFYLSLDAINRNIFETYLLEHVKNK